MNPSSPFHSGEKVVAYCRYSGGEEQGLKNTSTDEQEAAIRKYCDEQELVLVKVYADPFVSGRSTKGREHYLEMMSDLLSTKKNMKKKTDIAGIIAWDFERMHRNMDQAQLDAARLRMAGYKIYSLQQPVMDNGPFARVLEAMYFASAQNQSDMISADVKRALQHNFLTYKVIPRSCIPDGWIAVPVDMGFFSDGRPRSGYKAEPDPGLVEPIRKTVEARLSGRQIKDVKHLLPPAFAEHPEKVEKLMTKPLLYGAFTYGGTTIEDYCEPVIDKATWDRLQVANTASKKKTRRPGSGAYAEHRALLSGLCCCGACGEHVHLDRTRAAGKVYERYRCNGRHIYFRRDMLDDLILNAAIDLLSGDSYEATKQAILSDLVDTPSANTNEQINAEILKLDRQIESITDAIAEMGTSRALMLKLADLESRREVLFASLQPDDPVRRKDLEQIVDGLRDSMLSVLKNEKSTTDELRDALSLFISAVIVFPSGQVSVRYTLPGLIFGSEMSGTPSAPPEGGAIHSKMMEVVIRE